MRTFTSPFPNQCWSVIDFFHNHWVDFFFRNLLLIRLSTFLGNNHPMQKGRLSNNQLINWHQLSYQLLAGYRAFYKVPIIIIIIIIF